MSNEEYILYLEGQLNLHIKKYNDKVEKLKLEKCTISIINDLIFLNSNIKNELLSILEEYAYLNEIKVRGICTERYM
jgi:hypothetical protein